MINFLNVIHYPVFGGPHNRACRLNKALNKRGYKSILLLPEENGDSAEKLKKNGLSFFQIPLSRARANFNLALHWSYFRNFLREIQTIREIIRNKKIRLVLVSGLVNPHGAIAGVLENIPVVWQITDSRTPLILIYFLLPLVQKLADSVMFNGAGLRDLHMKKSSFNLPNFIYYPPVDTNCFQISIEKRWAMRQTLRLDKDTKVVGMVANLNPQKGIEYFIKAAHIIHRTIPNTKFLLIGARYESHFKYNQLINHELITSGVPRDCFIFTGAVSNVERFYPAMDVKLITSVPHSEGTTTTAMEAMACGIPVVATNVGSVREVVEDNVTGLIVVPQCPESIAHATIKLLRNDGLRQRMSEEGRMKAESLYEVEVCAETHVRAFEAAVTHHRYRRKKVHQMIFPKNC
jgi:glycosyltransferase involved in cell wall biosynthesis